MALGEQELSVILQASIEKAAEMLTGAGGFLPFGARAKPGGGIEFVQLALESEGEGLDALQERLGQALKTAAQAGEALASALVAHVAMPEGDDAGFERAIAVQIEAPEFCRLVVVPYRLADTMLELGKMLPEEAEPIIFA